MVAWNTLEMLCACAGIGSTKDCLSTIRDEVQCCHATIILQGSGFRV